MLYYKSKRAKGQGTTCMGRVALERSVQGQIIEIASLVVSDES